MKKIFIAVVFCMYYHSLFAQVGISSPMYKGNDAKLIASNWTTGIQLFIPIRFPIKTKDSARMFLSFRPGIKWDWYNFSNNLIVDRQNNYTSFIVDPEANDVYTNKFLRATSMMQSTSLYMPMELLLSFKKLRHFLFAPGVYVEYLIGGEFKRRYNDGSQEFIVDKYRDDKDYYGFQRFQYGFCAHITYRFITVYGVYSMTTLFKLGEGINARVYNVGIWFNFFGKHPD